jgi:hypothetical protein
MPPPIDPEGVKERTQNMKRKRREEYEIYKVCQPSMRELFNPFQP